MLLTITYSALEKANSYSKDEFEKFISIYYPKARYHDYKKWDEKSEYIYLILTHEQDKNETCLFYKYFFNDAPGNFINNLHSFDRIKKFQ